MWDNRLTKRNPKAPDYKCQNRSCDGVIWPAKPEVASPVGEAKQEKRVVAASGLVSADEAALPF